MTKARTTSTARNISEQLAAVGVTASAPAEPTRQTVTRASLESGIHEAMGVLAATFTELHLFCVGDNGKLFPVTSETPIHDLADDMGEERQVVERNAYAFQQRVILGGIVKQSEFLLELAEKKEQEQTFITQSVQRKYQRSEATETDLDRSYDWLDRAKLQAAVARATFQASIKSYEELTGEVFETKAMRLERDRMGKAKVAPPARSSAIDAFNA